MSVPTWQPGTLYNPGDIVRPRTQPTVVTGQVENGGFETGTTAEWTAQSVGGVGTLQATLAQKLTGSYSAEWIGGSGSGLGGGIEGIIISDYRAPVTPGKRITGKGYVKYNTQGSNTYSQGRARIYWYDAALNPIGFANGNLLAGTGINNRWTLSTVVGVAPANAAYASMAMWVTRNANGDVFIDDISWDYIQQGTSDDLLYRAVQTNAGYSGSLEPTWPTVLGNQVVDNEVTWEAVNATRVVWEASPVLVSDYNEPDWPEDPAAAVADGTILWKNASRRVTDANCPNTAVVAIGASKVFCANDDIIAFSATVNPLDWTTREDAGFLPFGLQNYGSMPVTALGLYRSNLVAFNAQGFQMWQIDEDPANMAILDTVPVPCTFPRTLQAVMNDLMFLSPVGVRNIGIAGASTNLQAGTFGEAVDPLVLAEIRAGTYEPISLSVSSYGQYWLIFGPNVYVMTVHGAKDMSWSRYTFPEAITDATILGNDVYLRTATHKVWKLDDAETVDDAYLGYGEDIIGLIQWPHLDLGNIGVEKQFVGFDLVADAPEGVSVSIGYDQRNLTARTDDYVMDADSLPGKLVPIAVSAPSFDMRLTFAAGQAWEWYASVVYVQDWRTGA